jgi:hypothetical protein
VKNRKQVGKRSPWGFVRNFQITRPDGTVYLTRNGVRTPYGGIYIHKMTGPDDRFTPHDHPWPFVSLIVKGGYDEVRIEKMGMSRLYERSVGRVNVMRRDDQHYISRIWQNPTWTVVFFGRRRRTWGFWETTDTAGKWIWTEFEKSAFERDRITYTTNESS